MFKVRFPAYSSTKDIGETLGDVYIECNSIKKHYSNCHEELSDDVWFTSNPILISDLEYAKSQKFLRKNNNLFDKVNFCLKNIFSAEIITDEEVTKAEEKGKLEEKLRGIAKNTCEAIFKNLGGDSETGSLIKMMPDILYTCIEIQRNFQLLRKLFNNNPENNATLITNCLEALKNNFLLIHNSGKTGSFNKNENDILFCVKILLAEKSTYHLAKGYPLCEKSLLTYYVLSVCSSNNLNTAVDDLDTLMDKIQSWLNGKELDHEVLDILRGKLSKFLHLLPNNMRWEFLKKCDCKFLQATAENCLMDVLRDISPENQNKAVNHFIRLKLLKLTEKEVVEIIRLLPEKDVLDFLKDVDKDLKDRHALDICSALSRKKNIDGIPLDLCFINEFASLEISFDEHENTRALRKEFLKTCITAMIKSSGSPPSLKEAVLDKKPGSTKNFWRCMIVLHFEDAFKHMRYVKNDLGERHNSNYFKILYNHFENFKIALICGKFLCEIDKCIGKPKNYSDQLEEIKLYLCKAFVKEALLCRTKCVWSVGSNHSYKYLIKDSDNQTNGDIFSNSDKMFLIKNCSIEILKSSWIEHCENEISNHSFTENDKPKQRDLKDCKKEFLTKFLCKQLELSSVKWISKFFNPQPSESRKLNNAFEEWCKNALAVINEDPVEENSNHHDFARNRR